MNITELIFKKKRGSELSSDEIQWIINSYTRGDVADYHMSALAMAICFQGMTDKETASLTYAMANSGDQLDLSMFGELTADKHSTGGVGDKTSLIIAPVVAALGAKVAKMSGRGLGHTGGTIDKLESIPGYNTSLSFESFINTVEKAGIALIGSNKNLAPADKKLYALRDVTATVDSIPLIASSIMSKKIASGSKNIVLDVKCGSGAFMKTKEEAVELAKQMVSIGKLCGRNISAIITDMDTPLGFSIGNALEVREAIEVLKGGGPEDLRNICVTLSAELLSLVFGGDWTNSVKQAINSGAAYDKFNEWITLQGGDISALNCACDHYYEYKSPCEGYISSMNSELIGNASMYLGAGRVKLDDDIDYAAGIVLKRKTGDYVVEGETIAVLQTNQKSSLKAATEAFGGSIAISNEPIVKKDLILDIIK